ncbi:hypothetical protein, partial [Dietzia sp.]|uniref:hypothetical protein n=1 Tax=Dietzia sp. TaxID=1871616 RepID=UPI002FD9D91D
ANTFVEVGALAAGPDVASGATPNHVSIDGRGNAYTVNKFAPSEGDNAGMNQVCKITPKTMLLGSIGDIPHGQILGSLPDAPLPELPVGSLIPGK